jgi:prophage regulatory protein
MPKIRDIFDDLPVVRLSSPATPIFLPDHTLRLVRMRGVIQVTSLSRATVYRRVANGTFPPPVKLSSTGRRVAWRCSDIESWIKNPLEWGKRPTVG